LNVIYTCYWGGYLAAVAASLHLGIIKGKKEIVWHKILKIPGFGKEDCEELGNLKLMGYDERGRKVYIMASKKAGPIVKRALVGVADVFGLGRNSIRYVELNFVSNIFTLLGVFIIRKTRFIKFGAWIFCVGIFNNYEKLEAIIQNIKDEPL